MEKMNNEPEQAVIERLEASLQIRDEIIKLQQEKIDAFEKLVEEIINMLKAEEN